MTRCVMMVAPHHASDTLTLHHWLSYFVSRPTRTHADVRRLCSAISATGRRGLRRRSRPISAQSARYRLNYRTQSRCLPARTDGRAPRSVFVRTARRSPQELSNVTAFSDNDIRVERSTDRRRRLRPSQAAAIDVGY